ncbi:hypothetical protein [Streptomyces sp. P9-2]|uniref:hypothetical protein n=1 Tax=Streptomyces sp. P9-2 TaxID=3423201 RepID=UPI003F74A297
MTTSNTTPPRRRSWPYVVVAAIMLTLQQGWEAEQVIALVTCLLVLIALITSASGRE